MTSNSVRIEYEVGHSPLLHLCGEEVAVFYGGSRTPVGTFEAHRHYPAPDRFSGLVSLQPDSQYEYQIRARESWLFAMGEPAYYASRYYKFRTPPASDTDTAR